MSILNDLLRTASQLKNLDVDIDLDDALDDGDVNGVSSVKSLSYDSIAKQAQAGVMQFPFIVSRTLSLENAQMVAKAGERNFSNFMQVIFTMNQITDAEQPEDYIRGFHQNMKTSVNGPSDVFSFIFNSADVPKHIMDKIHQGVIEGNLRFDDIFEMESLNDKYRPMDHKLAFHFKPVTESKGKGKGGFSKQSNSNSSGGNTYYNYSSSVGDIKMPKAYNPHQNPKDLLPTNIFVDSDVKKANEMVPTLMHVRILRQKGLNGENSEFVDFIVGVKATIHAIDSNDMITHLVSVFSEGSKLTTFIRWTSGELSFFKDLVFSVDKIKDEIKGVRSGQSSVWWTALKNAKTKRRLHKWTRRTPILPNASIVISTDEVDYIKANYGIDLLKDENGVKILDKLNILSFYIVDASSETVHVLVDGQDHYDDITFKGLIRDTGNAERQFKDILKAVNKLQ